MLMLSNNNKQIIQTRRPHSLSGVLQLIISSHATVLPPANRHDGTLLHSVSTLKLGISFDIDFAWIFEVDQ